jgi:hypothetical protein
MFVIPFFLILFLQIDAKKILKFLLTNALVRSIFKDSMPPNDLLTLDLISNLKGQ